MQKEIESLKSKLTDRILYKDLTGKILNTGDICLVTSKDKICLTKRKNHNYHSCSHEQSQWFTNTVSL